ncbi:MAG TPA: hypothetical protein VFQ25_11640 [Ktedonobacterales bacterium]|jgi:hypothetical protein|nr:hypothetical protein [Ktedonobacterales bacterium]HEX5156592.1 hypothetical protein [Ktedonobacterales bacterium]
MALHPRHSSRILATCSFVFPLIVFTLAGCVPVGSVSSRSPASSSAASASPTAAATSPTTTPLPIACAQLPGFANASALTLPNIEFPASAVATAPTTSGGNAGEFSLATYSVCVPDTTADLTVASGKGPKPFLTLLLFSGWEPIGTFPGDGRIQGGCGAAKCFALPDDQRYLAVDSVKALGNGLATFRLRHATPPPGPVCDPGAFPDASYQLASDQGNGVRIPLPPLSRVGKGQGAAGSTYIPICSAGTPASINAFFQQAAPIYGWVPGSNGASSWQQTKGGHTYGFAVTPVADATTWTLRIIHPQ